MEDDLVYEYEMSPGFVPFRRNIRYIPCRETPIRDLMDKLSFTRNNRHWGYLFRSGHF
ncbi:hypothetical protein [Paenibacillus hamazuiensis]|uniref:hypothetical protein n=1 Tax=Paenibacillus hamazuiensis TaxID=2936508 RepID=UPI0030843DF0